MPTGVERNLGLATRANLLCECIHGHTKSMAFIAFICSWLDYMHFIFCEMKVLAWHEVRKRSFTSIINWLKMKSCRTIYVGKWKVHKTISISHLRCSVIFYEIMIIRPTWKSLFPLNLNNFKNFVFKSFAKIFQICFVNNLHSILSKPLGMRPCFDHSTFIFIDGNILVTRLWGNNSYEAK